MTASLHISFSRQIMYTKYYTVPDFAIAACINSSIVVFVYVSFNFLLGNKTFIVQCNDNEGNEVYASCCLRK
ncbi:hypothetical protein EB796_013780 [Bugula neritina]|uniref:Uncharacterized protein n=1 Tax=Bugula neritina TaxID=10212 RepID=A0A7J7JR51_BUGNE|nr:hypothetical protein EB796_013780 [Bugula neritina]